MINSESTYYTTGDNAVTDTITFNLGKKKIFDVLMLQEVIEWAIARPALSQRFPLSRRIRDLHPIVYAHAGHTTQKRRVNRSPF